MEKRDSMFADISAFFDSKTDHNTIPISGLSAKEQKEINNKNVEKFYSKLEELGYNLDELKEILDCEDSMLILSGAGSGKTTALILKIIRDLISGDLIKTREINGISVSTPANILVSTFLKSGAEELKQSFTDWCRKLNIVGIDTSYIQFSTIHSEVYRVLKSMGMQLNIIENTDAIMRKVMHTYNVHSVMSNGRNITLDEVADVNCLVSYVRNRLDAQRYNHPLMDEYTIDTMQLDLMLQTFKQHKMAQGVIDFEDMQEILLEGLKCNPNVVNFVQGRYDYIYVDEFQDTSQLQYEILKYYFASAKRVLCIGDDGATSFSISA